MRRVVDAATNNVQPESKDEIDRNQAPDLSECGTNATLYERPVCPLRSERNPEERKHAT
jgi:hypothetical protein